MGNTKRHLLRSGRGDARVAACGLRNPAIYTYDLASVDCRACQRTLYMADAELRKQQHRKRRFTE